MNDLISRQAAIKNARFPMIDDAGYEIVRVDDILALPSIKQKTKCIAQIKIDRNDIKDFINETVNEIIGNIAKPKTGKWIDDKCSICGSERAWYGEQPDYCPDCGARMIGKGNA